MIWPFNKLTRAALLGSIVSHTATDGRDMLHNDPDGWEIDQPWLWWSGAGGSEGHVSGPFGNPPPGAGWPGFAGRGGGIPAVTRCTSLVADTIAGLPFHVYKGREQLSTPDWLTDPQATRLDERVVGAAVPNVRFSAVEFWSQVMTSLLWYGEGIIYVPVRDEAGRPVPPLWVLHPDDVKVVNGAYVVGTETAYEVLGPDELIVVRGLTRPGKVRGVGVLQAHMHDLGLASKIREYAAGTLETGVPAGYLKTHAPDLTEAEADKTTARWMSIHGRRKRIAMLNATTDFHALQMDAQALQLIELRRYSLLDIALLFGVPPYMIGIGTDGGGSITYANVESRMIEFAQFTLFMWVRRLEATLSAQFPRGTQMKVNLDALRRADTKTRYESHKTGLDAGFLDVDEVRDLEDLPPREEGGAAA